MAKKDLTKAKKNKNDEFYTQLSDIEKELKHYKEYFKNKTIYCNCDDPRESNFFKYFYLNFEFLGLKRLICSCYKNQNIDLFSKNESDNAVWIEYEGNGNIENFDNIKVNNFKDNGDFRNKESIELLKKADIVVTNPPFSLFREYIAQLMEYNKKFILIGNTNALTYKEIFTLFQENKIQTGNTNFNVGMFFQVPDYFKKFTKEEEGKKFVRVSTSCWFTNLPVKRHNDFIPLYKKYNKEEYPEYENYDGINVDKVSEIPKDYNGVMGVPITFLDKYNPEQFEIIGFRKGNDNKDLRIKEKSLYFRMLIKRKNGGME